MSIIQVLARILYRAAREHGYVDQHKVEEILHVKPDEMTSKPEHVETDQALETEMSGKD